MKQFTHHFPQGQYKHDSPQCQPHASWSSRVQGEARAIFFTASNLAHRGFCTPTQSQPRQISSRWSRSYSPPPINWQSASVGKIRLWEKHANLDNDASTPATAGSQSKSLLPTSHNAPPSSWGSHKDFATVWACLPTLPTFGLAFHSERNVRAG